jgi:hypothetical protein
MLYEWLIKTVPLPKAREGLLEEGKPSLFTLWGASFQDCQIAGDVPILVIFGTGKRLSSARG